MSDWELGREPIAVSEAELRAALGSQNPPPTDARAVALRHLTWIAADAAVARKHAAGLQRRVREAITALEALRSAPAS